MGIRKGDTITIQYRGRLEGGQEFGSSVTQEPIEFTVGTGQVIEAIDNGVEGLAPGDHREINVTPETGYGNRRDELIRTVPKTMLGDQVVMPGEAVEIQTEDGQILIAEVVSVNDESVTFDLNHPFAGRSLTFDVEVIDIKQKAA